jgi:hypothetical protein
MRASFFSPSDRIAPIGGDRILARIIQIEEAIPLDRNRSSKAASVTDMESDGRAGQCPSSRST